MKVELLLRKAVVGWLSGLDAAADKRKSKVEISFAYVASTEAEWFLQYQICQDRC